MEPGKAMCDHSWRFTSSEQSLVKIPIVCPEPRARPVINHVGVTNVARHCKQEIPVPEVWVHPQGANNHCPLWREAYSGSTGPVRLCSGKRMQEDPQSSPPVTGMGLTASKVWVAPVWVQRTAPCNRKQTVSPLTSETW
jgi:hypothetical protein